MTRLYTRIIGTGAGGYFATGDPLKKTPVWIPMQYNLELLALGSCFRNALAGGSTTLGIDASAAGDFDVFNPVQFLIDNSNSQISGATNLVAQMRYYVRVSNVAVSVTPKVFYGTSATAVTTAATVSGTAACIATDADYSGTSQIQTVAITIPAGVKWFKAGFTIGGTPAAGYQAWVSAYFDLYIND